MAWGGWGSNSNFSPNISSSYVMVRLQIDRGPGSASKVCVGCVVVGGGGGGSWVVVVNSEFRDRFGCSLAWPSRTINFQNKMSIILPKIGRQQCLHANRFSHVWQKLR